MKYTRYAVFGIALILAATLPAASAEHDPVWPDPEDLIHHLPCTFWVTGDIRCHANDALHGCTIDTLYSDWRGGIQYLTVGCQIANTFFWCGFDYQRTDGLPPFLGCTYPPPT